MAHLNPLLSPLFAPLTGLSGVGTRYAKLLAGLVGPYMRDLLWHKPVEMLDRTHQPKIAELNQYADQIVTLEVTVSSHNPPARKNMPFKIIVGDETGFMEIIFFRGKPEFWQKSLPLNSKKIISGKIDFFKDIAQMAHPDYIGNAGDMEKIKGMEPIYPLTYGVTNKFIRKCMQQALGKLPELPEWLDSSLIAQKQWLDWRTAMQTLHNPTDKNDLLPDNPVRQRLAYDEILSHQLALTLVRNIQRSRAKQRQQKPDGHLRQKLLALLPFTLTPAQQSAMAEIDTDMQSEQPMLRLLQGDVGSGKTIIALLTMLNAIECGKQAVLMAPTEILARQHQQTIQPLLEKMGLRLAVLTGRDKGKSREKILESIASKQADIIIGTHAVIEEKVIFPHLGCVVIDEQHRFGVEQRLGLLEKGRGADLLVMTATPIPRSLYLAIYGDLDTSRLLQKPPGRKPIDTRTISIERMDEVVTGLKRAIADNRQIYWVCPLVAESEVLDLAAAEERYKELQKFFGDKVGLIHGRIKAKDKESVMRKFSDNEIKILVATTVIEVGVNVPNASIMVIDHAERFGLSQLHQLRGRIGRGEQQSTCLLLYQNPLGEVAKARLNILRDTEDGFRIAEEDLKLRGAGEILGTRQSGLPDFKLADFFAHQDLFKLAQSDVKLILQQDPLLQNPRGKNLRLLLQLFSRNDAVHYLGSG